MLDQALLASMTLISGDMSISCERMFPPVRMSTAREPPFDLSSSIFIRNIRPQQYLELNRHFCNIGQIEGVFSNSQHTG